MRAELPRPRAISSCFPSREFVGIQTIALLLCASLAARAGDTTAPVITHTPPTVVAGQPIHFTAHIVDESRIFPQLFVRYGTSGPYQQPLDLKRVNGSKEDYEGSVAYKPGPIDYYLECYDEYGNGPARTGSANAPLRLPGVEAAAAVAKSDPNSLPMPQVTEPDRIVARPPPSAESADTTPPALPAYSGAATDFASTSTSAASPSSPAIASDAVANTSGTSVDTAPASPSSASSGGSSASLNLRLVQPAQPITRREAALHSLLIPGWGQYQSERRARGVVFGVATGGSLIATIWLAVRANQANDIYNNAPLSVRGEAYDQATHYARARNAMLGITVGLWALNVAEAWFRYGNKDPW